MTLTATDYEPTPPGDQPERGTAPVIDMTHWGYAIHEPHAGNGLVAVIRAAGRFVGTILLLAAAGLVLIPDASGSVGAFGMKLAATVMFAVFGLAFLVGGQPFRPPEIHIDTIRSEIRIGRRGVKGQFQRKATLGFEDVGSVYLLRSKDHSQPARLFLRLAGSDEAIEVARGPEQALNALRERLAVDLSRSPRQPAANAPRRVRPRRVA